MILNENIILFHTNTHVAYALIQYKYVHICGSYISNIYITSNILSLNI